MAGPVQLQTERKQENPVLQSISKAAMLGANSPVAKAVLTGVYEAVKFLTDDQRNFQASLERRKDLGKDKYPSFSALIKDVALSNMCAAFPNFDTPGALHIVEQARKKVGVIPS